MRQKIFIPIIALLCAVVQMSWAQASWEVVCAMTNTTTANWTQLNAGSTTGRTLGAAGTTTYYYADTDLTFTNSNTGGSGLTIQGKVYLYVPEGVTVTCTGANADGTTGAGAGIELAMDQTLFLLGKGTVKATGGNAANGGNGENGKDASDSSDEVGGGGTGGNGGGGAGAGIGTRGGAGGDGGSAPESEIYTTWVGNGVAGSAGSAGLTADAMGNLYASNGFTLNVTGGSKGSAGSAGSAGKSYLSGGYSLPGGGGGGAGGFGGAAMGIGSGGPGGGGGGGGAKGSHTWATWGFFQVYANGGGGGQNADGSFAADGGTAGVSKDNVANGLCATNNEADWFEKKPERTGGDVTTTINGGSGGAAGTASTSGSAITVEVKWPTQGNGTEEAPFIIGSTDDWNNFASCVSSGVNFSGIYVKLNEDISVMTVAGTHTSDSDNKPFSGTFLGGGHTLTLTITDNTNSGTAPFRSINGATIKNLKVAGTINGGMHAAAIVGFAQGTGNVIEGCVAAANVSGGTHIGGILGHGTSSDIAISGCVFCGTMNGGGTAKGVFFGWGDNGGTKSVTDCLYLMANGQNTDGLDLVRKNGGTVSVTNCYKTANAGSNGKYTYAYTTAPANLGDLVQDYGMLKAYENGILYNGTYYVAPATLSLADNADNSTTISGADGYLANVTLAGRTLYKDGAWNTLCLPFNVDSFTGTPLEDATVKTLTSTSFSGGTLTMDFTDGVTSIEAGKPYIVKWENSPIDPIDLSTLSADYTAQDGEVLTGTLGANVKISIAADATVKLQDVTINGTGSYQWAGISCLGDATINLKGENTLRGFEDHYPGIHVPVGSTLTIVGSGSLNASSNGDGAGIGGGNSLSCGNIVIKGGTITATGGHCCGGIGAGNDTAYRETTCGDITITDGVTSVTAIKGDLATNSIGAGTYGSCGTVTIGPNVGAVTTSPYTYNGTGSGSFDGDVEIASPVFNNVIISDAPANVETSYVDFVGCYRPVGIYTAEKTNLYLGADNKLYYPTDEGFKVNAFRGYFQLKQCLTANSNQASVPSFKLKFGDDEATSVTTPLALGRGAGGEAWYSLDGRKLGGKPTQRGIYINNGCKVVMK